MQTTLFQAHELEQAAQLLRQGELVAFPTETVFGLGADATNFEAVAKVFAAKGRPSDNPLIVHVSSSAQVRQYTQEISPLAQRLMDTFWPGPLTIILPVAVDVFPSNVNAGKATIAFRMPNQAETLRLIELAETALVGPSANISGKPSPTRAEHVLHDFNGKIAGVVAGTDNVATIGVESTVVLPLENSVRILRPGAITKTMLQQVCADVEEVSASQQLADQSVMSPGVKYTHYSPQQPVYILNAEESLADWQMKLQQLAHQKIGLLADQTILQSLAELPMISAHYSLGEAGDVASATRQLYAGLRALEQSDCEVIVVQGLLAQENSHAYLNRLYKAAEKEL